MSKFGVKEVSDVMFVNMLTNKVDLFLDTLKMSNLENANESSYATGGQGAARLVGWDYGRTANFVLQDALLNPQSIAMQAGTELEKKKGIILERIRAITVDDSGDSKIELPFEPIAGTIQIYETENGYRQEKEVDTSSITVSGTTVTVPSAELAVDQQVIVYFKYETVDDAEIITIKSDQFGGFYTIYGKTVWRSEATGQDEKVQIYIPKAKISSAFTLTMQPDGDPSVFDMNLDVFKDPTSTDMVQLTRY